MIPPLFTVALRDKGGVAKLFHIQHESVQTHEDARGVALAEFPDAPVILVSGG